MPDKFIGIDIVGLPEVQAKLQKLVDAEMADKAADEAAKYLKDVLKAYPSQQSISRKQAYPEVGGWFSERQRRWFFAALNSGEIDVPYRRTQSLRNAWQIVGHGRTLILANEMPYASLVYGSSSGAEQSRMSKLGGWDRIPIIIQERQKRINEIIEAVIQKEIKKAGLK